MLLGKPPLRRVVPIAAIIQIGFIPFFVLTMLMWLICSNITRYWSVLNPMDGSIEIAQSSRLFCIILFSRNPRLGGLCSCCSSYLFDQ